MGEKKAAGAPAPPEQENPPEVEERRWATPDVLGDTDWEPLLLPGLKVWVRVRRLATHEVAALQFLPVLVTFQDLMERMGQRLAALQGNREERRAKKKQLEKVPEVDTKRLAVEQARYSAHLAHVAVLAHADVPDEEYLVPDAEPCPHEECRTEDGTPLEHPPSLWSPQQTYRLMQPDTSAIIEVALGIQAVSGLIPFSGVPSPNGSASPAGTGE